MRIWQIIYPSGFSEIVFGKTSDDIWAKFPGIVQVYEVFIH